MMRACNFVAFTPLCRHKGRAMIHGVVISPHTLRRRRILSPDLSPRCFRCSVLQMATENLLVQLPHCFCIFWNVILELGILLMQVPKPLSYEFDPSTWLVEGLAVQIITTIIAGFGPFTALLSYPVSKPALHASRNLFFQCN